MTKKAREAGRRFYPVYAESKGTAGEMQNIVRWSFYAL